MQTIIHVITRLDRGGAAINTLQNCLGTCDRYRILLVHGLAIESSMTSEEQAVLHQQCQKGKQLGIIFLPLASLVRRIAPWHDIKSFFSLLWLFMCERPEMVHTHTSKAGILGRLAAWIARVPIIIHTPHGHVFYGHFGPKLSFLYLAIERLFAHTTTYMVALTKGEKNDYIRLRVGNPDKMPLIHSGVDIDLFCQSRKKRATKRAKLGIDKDSFIVGTVGWLLPIKGPLVLLEAMEKVWKSYPKINLVYVGKGDLEEKLRQGAENSGHTDHLKLLGWRNDVHEIMGIFDCFVLPSMNEGMGRVVVEAMATGCPVVASNTGGIPDLVKDGHNGLLAPPGNAKTLADAILKIIEHPTLAATFVNNGREVCKRYSQQAMIDKLHRLYAHALTEQTKSAIPAVLAEQKTDDRPKK